MFTGLSKSSAEALTAFHTSSIVEKSRQTALEKKTRNVIQFKPKSKSPVVALWKGITVTDFAERTNKTLDHIFEALTYTENGALYSSPKSGIHSTSVLRELAKRVGYRVQIVGNPHANADAKTKDVDVTRRPPPDPSELEKRPPVVTIMGHVDHGKTTLLDSLRHTSVVKQEYGGITQHIGAFTVKVSQGEITFLDTPGHAAFKTMRARGANVTDIVVLVVAADDGVMEQTLESIRFANEAGVPIIVAINKIDKPLKDVDAVKQELLVSGVQLEELGGEVQSVCISALKKINLEGLVEAILTQAELMGIGGDPKGSVEGVVLEASVDKARGKLSTSLVQRGTLRKGAFLVAGTSWAKIRGMFDEWGKPLQVVTPGLPVQLFGWKSLPCPGDEILEVQSEKQAQAVVAFRIKKKTEEKMQEDLIVIEKKAEEHRQKYQQEREERLRKGFYRKRLTGIREKESVDGPTPRVSFVLKGDVDGSIEAIEDVIYTYPSHNICRLDLIRSGVGDVTESDISFAESFNGIIYCFNVKIPQNLKPVVEEKNIPIKTFNVIYHLIDDLKLEINKRLPLMRDDEIIGEAHVLQQFLINEGRKKVPVAGCKCVKGVLKKGSLCKIVRSGETIHEDSVISLRHEKSDVESIKKDVECGLRIENKEISFMEGDVIVCYSEKYIPQCTDWNPGF